ncbi:hypothetical protein CR159_20625 [Pollutimonas subterranea]|uniref:Antitoxin Xre/MbcA/ParS-like toxin-binding domain-containing protein n=1 Tax=Pollutimonas subterranea TaxID=2045210 RepID=A0A2N4TYY1_9BURK|nr:MbcA/ParS/Xre antitoxin family protein [Pollutimonas subterranea]PLC47972.1 hypothetical protein CR159_20625 [Pollutimonas subterranea]
MSLYSFPRWETFRIIADQAMFRDFPDSSALRSSGHQTPNQTSGERANHSAVHAMLTTKLRHGRILGARDKAKRWLSKPKERFNGQIPMALICSFQGMSLVEEMLLQIAEGYAL